MHDRPSSHDRGRFGRFWAAAAISSFGTAVTAVAMPVLVVQVLTASPLEVGIVNAAQFLPYALLGLFAGVYTDRWRRTPILMWGSIGRAVSLGAIPLLWLVGALHIWVLVVLLLVFGACSVFAFAATQSLLPSIVPPDRLVVANARLDQTDAGAQTLGPALGGGLVSLLGAPLAIVVDAVSYLIDATLIAGLRVDERARPVPASRNLRREITEGLRWMYGHATLGPLAVSTHVWFLANGAALTTLSVLALRTMGLSAVTFGLLMAVSGVAGLIGATLAPAIGRRIGVGRAVLWSRAGYPVAWLLVAVAAAGGAGPAVLFVALTLYGFAGGVENSNEMGYWQRVTPDALLGRVNASRRSANRTAAAIGAVLAGSTITAFGESAILFGVAVLFVVSVIIARTGPFKTLSAPEDH